MDGIAVAVAYLKSTSLGSLVGGRVASRHHYAREWPVGEPGVVVREDRDVPLDWGPHDTRLDVYLYGKDTLEVEMLWQALQGCGRSERFLVAVGGDQALVYFFRVNAGLWYGHEKDLQMEIGRTIVHMMWRKM